MSAGDHTEQPGSAVQGDAALRGKYGDVLRPFVVAMEAELHANAGKGDRPGWLAMSPQTALLEIYYHLGKLQRAVKKEGGDLIREYAADVANMSMMLLDICGGLALIEDTTPPPAPAAEQGDALAAFTDYFVRNYPGPDTVIMDPRWHASRIFRAAQYAISAATQPEARGVEGMVLTLWPVIERLQDDAFNAGIAAKMYDKRDAYTKLVSALAATPNPVRAEQPDCRCVDCGGDQPSHDPTCSYMRELVGEQPEGKDGVR